MADIRVPTLGESVTEATVGKWFKQPGDAGAADEPLVELETDKVTLEVPAPAAGVLFDIAAKNGDTVAVGALLGQIKEGAGAPKAAAPAPRPAEAPKLAASEAQRSGEVPMLPSVRKMAAESGVDTSKVSGTGMHGQVTKGDMLSAIERAAAQPTPVAAPAPMRAPSPADDAAREERVHMTRLRQTIARRLKDAQNTAAMLTTFNEVDMSAVMHMRNQYKELFEKKHGVKLGFMGFFVRACIQALKEIPAVNAEIDGTDIVYKNYYHIGIAVGTDKGLVVPVVRDAQTMSLAEIEKTITDFGRRARDGSLKIEEMQGGTFTITNGGVYGSLMSTPILNAPQSGILGMHKIQERPVVLAGKVEARPMMYLALSYDHRLVDGREAVSFLVRVKEGLEDRARVALDFYVYGLRPHRYPHWPWRLRLCHPRGAAWAENRGGRKKRHLWRHLSQYRLHPLEGDAARVRIVRRSRPQLWQDGHRRVPAEARSQGHDGIQGPGGRKQCEGRRLSLQEKQNRWLQRHGAHHGARQGRSKRRRRQDADTGSQIHRYRHGLGCCAAEGHRNRREAYRLIDRCVVAAGCAEAPPGRGRRRDRA